MGQLISNGINYTGAGGGGAEIEEMTQAEYDALPDTKLTDGVLRAIKDDYSPSDTKMVGLADCYSLSEKQVGCWTDGKPLYQKTIISDVSQSTGSISIATGISDIDEIANFNGSWSYGTNSSWIPLPFSDDSNQTSISNSIVKIRNIRKSDGVLTLYIGNDYTGTYAVNKIRVTLQYTKTTDTAGSGTWTPEGTPTHQYDGSEKVVGTWFGETLYEKTKTIAFSSFTHQGNLYYASIRDDATQIVRNVTGVAYSSVYGTCQLGCKNYIANNSESYWELIMYYTSICLKFYNVSASEINVSTVTFTYQYTKSS